MKIWGQLPAPADQAADFNGSRRAWATVRGVRFRFGGALQRPFCQTAMGKFARHVRIRTVCPAVYLGLLPLLGNAHAQRACHGHHVHQIHFGLEFGVEHHGTAHIADGALCGAAHHRHQTGEVQQQPHQNAAAHGGHTLPAQRIVGHINQHRQAQRNHNIAHIHGLIVLWSELLRFAGSAYILMD